MTSNKPNNILLTTDSYFGLPNTENRNPIAILDLAAYYRKQGIDVDCYYIDEALNESFDKNYDLVGYSILFSLNDNETLKKICSLKTKFNCQIIVGGRWTKNLSNDKIKTLESQDINIYNGYGEHLFINERINYNKYPAWNPVDFETLNFTGEEVMSTRGCVYNCSFCDKYFNGISYFSICRTASNVKTLWNKGKRKIFFMDDIFLINTERVIGLFDKLKSDGIDLRSKNKLFLHINYINNNVIDTLKRILPFEVQIGIESGSDNILKNMNKTFTAQTALKRIKELGEQNIPVKALFMLGFPGETKKTVGETLDFVDKIKPYVKSFWVSYFQPIKNSRITSEINNQAIYKSGLNSELNYLPAGLDPRVLIDARQKILNYNTLKP